MRRYPTRPLASVILVLCASFAFHALGVSSQQGVVLAQSATLSISECTVEAPHSFPVPGSVWDWCASNMAVNSDRYRGCIECCVDETSDALENSRCYSRCAQQWLANLHIIMLIWGDDDTCTDFALQQEIDDVGSDVTVAQVHEAVQNMIE